jgi:hypothetical protein
MKTDCSIRNICLGAIKRKSSNQEKWLFTRYFETETFADLEGTCKFPTIHLDELPISQVFIDPLNWTFITTRQIITCYNGITKSMAVPDIKGWRWNDFKSHGKTPYTIGKLQNDFERQNQLFVELNDVDDPRDLKIFIETGKASMVAIYAIMTLGGLAKDQSI